MAPFEQLSVLILNMLLIPRDKSQYDDDDDYGDDNDDGADDDDENDGNDDDDGKMSYKMTVCTTQTHQSLSVCTFSKLSLR